jgi:holo-[acyl-carrier protein] synthase
MKAMGVGLWKFKLRDVEVVRARSGAPSVALHGKAATMAAERGVTSWVLSLTHTDTTALAVAVALTDVPPSALASVHGAERGETTPKG